MASTKRDLVSENIEEEALADALVRHIPILLSLAASLAFGFKVLQVSASNVSTALEVVRSAGLFQVLTAVAITLLPIAPIYATGFYLALRARSDVSPALKARVFQIILGLSAVFLLIGDWFSIAILAGVVLVWLGLRGARMVRRKRDKTGGVLRWLDEASSESKPVDENAWRSKEPVDVVIHPLWIRLVAIDDQLGTDLKEDERRSLKAEFDDLAAQYEKRRRAIDDSRRKRPDLILLGVLLASLPVQMYAVLNRTMWLPAEVVQTSAPSERYVGYVLSDDGGWTVILLDKPREIVRLPSAAVTSRHLCALSSQGDRTVAQMIGEDHYRAIYPQCNDR